MLFCPSHPFKTSFTETVTKICDFQLNPNKRQPELFDDQIKMPVTVVCTFPGKDGQELEFFALGAPNDTILW